MIKTVIREITQKKFFILIRMGESPPPPLLMKKAALQSDRAVLFVPGTRKAAGRLRTVI